MNNFFWVLLSLVLSFFIVSARAEEGESTAVFLPYPAMSGFLTTNPNPFNIETKPLGEIYVTGIVSGFGLFQDNPVLSNPDSLLDVSNAQLFIQNTQGFFQFYIQIGSYSLPALGLPYLRMKDATDDFYGLLPSAFIQLVPNHHFSFMVGKLPALIGNENTFSFENASIETGLLGNQTSGVSRGAQINLTQGRLQASVSITDGFYSGKWSWLSGLLTFKINAHHQVTAVAAANVGQDSQSNLVTPLPQNNSQIYDLIYAYTQGRLIISPTLQYTHVPENADIGLTSSASTIGAALWIQYALDAQWGISGRAEYIDTTGGTNLAYGPGSYAWSLTLTPTYQHKRFFARGEASLVSAGNITPGSAFGPSGNENSQKRLLLETGVLF